ncbi:MAG: FAD-linked oxidase C-terminal domain-containing protein, partial [Candidatus Thorarchaeota archaeon]
LYKKIIIPVGGTLTGEHGIGKVKTPYLEFEHGTDIVTLMSEVKELFDPKRILNPGIGKGDMRPLKKVNYRRNLKNQSDRLLELECMRCGFCITKCPSRIHHLIEPYSPRGRLSILNGLVYGELELNDYITEILQTCTLCALCDTVCPAGVRTSEIFEKAREIIHKAGRKI